MPLRPRHSPSINPLLALLAGALISGACAGTSPSPLPVPAMPPIEEPPTPTTPTPPAEPKRDKQKDPVACQEARAQLKVATRDAADGCSETNPCILDSDCQLRTVGADPALIVEARALMERACTPSGAIARSSCTERPANCQAGKCVAQADSTP